MSVRGGRLATLAGALAGAGVGVWWLLRLGHGALAAPPTGSIEQLHTWAATRGPAGAAMAVVRLAALAAAAWTWVGAAGLLVAELRPGTPAAALAHRLAPAALRHVLGGLAGISLVAVAAPSAAHAGPVPAQPGEAEPGTATVRPLPPDGPTADHPPPTTPPPTPDPAPPPDAPPPEPGPAGTATADHWVVEPGDSCWRIASDVLADALGRPPGDPEIVPYWQELVGANHDRFVTGDPDLIHPGQELRLPPVPQG